MKKFCRAEDDGFQPVVEVIQMFPFKKHENSIQKMIEIDKVDDKDKTVEVHIQATLTSQKFPINRRLQNLKSLKIDP